MVSPTKQGYKLKLRSPLKENDPNSKTSIQQLGLLNKKRSLNILEQEQNDRERVKYQRSIGGAVLITKQQGLKRAEQQKVTAKDLLEWQANWRRIMKKDSRIYFDTTDSPDISIHTKQKNDKRKDLLKRGFLSLGAKIISFFDTDVTIVITGRKISSYNSLSEKDVLYRAHKNGYMKIWYYDKATRFLKNLDVDLENTEKLRQNVPSTLSNLLETEKIYGPSDRDPKAKRDDIYYFKNSFVYLYDLWQIWAPIIIMEWRSSDINNKLPYPTIKPGSFGRCPFTGDGSCDERSIKRILKRYKRDTLNESYALHLRLLYQNSAEPASLSSVDIHNDLLIIPHDSLDSKQCYNMVLKQERQHQNDEGNFIQTDFHLSKKSSWKSPFLPHILLKQETEDLANDDLCKKKSRIPYEIKASGISPSLDSQSVGNGLAPTKASNLNKNIKNLNRLVVDRKISSATNCITATTASTNIKYQLQETTKPLEYKSKLETQIKRNSGKLSSGYCENCRVKYDHLDDHIKAEKHRSFASNDLNFESIDHLIEKLQYENLYMYNSH